MLEYSNINLKNWNTFGINASAAQVLVIIEESEIEVALHQIENAKPLILGGGSNMLLTQDIVQPILKNEIKGIHLYDEDDAYWYVVVGAGEVWHDFVMHAVDHNWAGVENLSLIPGTVGAAPIQNIGAYGVEVQSVIEKVRYYHISTRTFKEISASECAFGYRESIFKHALKNDYIITQVFFKLHKIPTISLEYGTIFDELQDIKNRAITIKDISEAVIRIRSSKLPNPAEIGNSGSFFKNPIISKAQFQSIKDEHPTIPNYDLGDIVKVPAAWMIEQCGWKGYRKEDYGVHTRQALVLVNYGTATGRQIYDLSTEIIDSVQLKFGITLEREVQIIPSIG